VIRYNSNLLQIQEEVRLRKERKKKERKNERAYERNKPLLRERERQRRQEGM
jgi:hypothetical protein